MSFPPKNRLELSTVEPSGDCAGTAYRRTLELSTSTAKSIKLSPRFVLP